MGRVYHYSSLPSAIVQFLCLSRIIISSDASNSGLNQANIFAMLLLISTLALTRYVGGWSVVTLPHIICTFFLIMLMVTNSQSVLLYGVAALFWIIHLAMICFYYHYELPKPTGRFKAGFMNITYNNVSISVFYPTEDINKPLAKLFHANHYLENVYTIATCLLGRVPRFLLAIANHYSTKLPIHAYEGARLTSLDDPSFENTDKKLIPIIFSHGLGAHCNAYSTICNTLASHGYIVFSVDHSDDIVGVVTDRTLQVAKKYLVKRVSQCRTIIDGLEKGNLLSEQFNGPVLLALDKLTIMGHSYGGATSAATAIQDSRIKNCVLLDPYLEPLDKKEELEKKLSSNLLILESDTWDAKRPHLEIRLRNKLLAKSQAQNGKVTLYSVVGRSDHTSFADNALFTGQLLKASKLIKYYGEIEEMMSLITSSIQKYMKIIVEGQRENNDVNLRMERYLEAVKGIPNLSFETI